MITTGLGRTEAATETEGSGPLWAARWRRGHAAARPRPRLGWRRVLWSLVRSRSGFLGVATVTVIVATAVLAPVVSPHNPAAVHLGERLRPGFWSAGSIPGYLLGTDQVGRDILSRLVWGSRVSLLVSLWSVLIAGVVGVVAGLAAAHFRGTVDYVLVGVANVFQSIPLIVLALALVAVLGPGLRNVVLALGVTSWPLHFRIVRAQGLVVGESDYVLVARALGARDPRIIFRHVLPNVVNSIIVLLSLQTANVILAEAFISYVGLGVQPPMPSWGNMLAESRAYIATQWWLSTFPGLAILVTVLGINFLGDWLRDVLDPQLQLEKL